MIDSLTDPFVANDQDDSAPGSVVTITAGGFEIGDPLIFEITVIDPAPGATLCSVAQLGCSQRPHWLPRGRRQRLGRHLSKMLFHSNGTLPLTPKGQPETPL
jgi:hypothetical protein